jgi:putative addiction module killer protein
LIEVRQSDHFSQWLLKLRDSTARARILTRIRRLREGNPGDSRSVGSGIVELKIDYGPGYRVYFIRRGETLVVLLCGGDKSSQQQDILRAKDIAREYQEA